MLAQRCKRTGLGLGLSLRSSLGIHATAQTPLTNFNKVVRSFKSIRFNSTKASTSASTTSMSWEQFLSLRKQQRRLGGVGSVIAALFTMAGSFSYFSQIEIDPTETIFGLDIFTVYVGAIICTGFVGFMLGPSIVGDPLFAILNRSKMSAYQNKQKSFLKHIAKMRVDASRQSMNNPVPDYYGEKIGSLKDYRQWLRDCNEYRRKARDFL